MSGDDGYMISMEELGRAKKIRSREEAGESRGSNKIVEKCKELSPETLESAMGYSLGSEAEEYLKSLDNVIIHVQEQTTKPRIPKVPVMMLNNQYINKYFAPRLVSIGPYHHHKEDLKVTQKKKLKFAAMFIQEQGVNKEDLYLKIFREIENLRNWYVLDATQCYDNYKLAWMFLIDGCIVLHFIYVFFQIGGNQFTILEILKGFEFIQDPNECLIFVMDLLLLENQIPYQVLDWLIQSSKSREKLEESVQLFMHIVTYNGLNSQLQIPEKERSHLLDLVRQGLIQPPDLPCRFTVQKYLIKIINKLRGILPFLAMVLLHILLYGQGFISAPSLRSIAELKEAGIKLKYSGTCYFTDVGFSHGTLKLPAILINKLTPFKFFNLLAYERSLNSPNECKISSYIYFLASLIVQAEDVKELRNKKILVNFCDNDEEVVKLFKEFTTDEVIGPLVDDCNGVRRKINKYCGKKYHVWMAQLKNKYFESPWSVIALVGGTIALSTTTLQTVYTVLAYYKSNYGST